MRSKTAESLWWLGMGLAVATTGIAIASTAHGETQAAGPLQTVDHVDLQRYLGTWYEIARYPNRFERDWTATPRRSIPSAKTDESKS